MRCEWLGLHAAWFECRLVCMQMSRGKSSLHLKSLVLDLKSALHLNVSCVLHPNVKSPAASQCLMLPHGGRGQGSCRLIGLRPQRPP